ncbi:MAG: branched-chain amino acid aminotransferase [Cyclobacteriaceae bacterium]|jgi:branched-chain amino acid aminotransferase
MYYTPDSYVFLDGNWVLAKEANTSLFNQTLHYGYGVFDGLRSYKNGESCNIFKAKEHFDRLIKSAENLHIEIPYSSEELVGFAYDLLNKNKLYTAYIRPLVFLGPNMELNTDSTVHFFMGAWKWKKYLGYEPIDVMVSQYVKLGQQHTPVNAKIIGNYTNSILASSQAKKLGYHEALMLDSNGFVAEGPAANFFYEKGDTIYTPTTSHALPGITRKTIMALARKWGVEVVEKDIELEEIYGADSAFFTGTATEVTPIRSINGEAVKKQWEDSHGHSLYMMYRQMVVNNEYMDLTIV